MTKLLENIYRCVNIALVNELKLLSPAHEGIDIWEVIEAASTKPLRISSVLSGARSGRALHPGRSLLSFVEGEGSGTSALVSSNSLVKSTPICAYHVLASVSGALNTRKKSVNGAKVLVLGVAYKKDIDDLR